MRSRFSSNAGWTRRTRKEQDKRITEVEDKLNNTINQMPFLYTLREDFIRSSAQQTQKLDQIITLLMKREEK
mgnify:CR=1 FL=1